MTNFAKAVETFAVVDKACNTEKVDECLKNEPTAEETNVSVMEL